MNYEVRLLNSIVDTQDYVTAVNSGVENVFLEYRDVWNFMLTAAAKPNVLLRACFLPC